MKENPLRITRGRVNERRGGWPDARRVTHLGGLRVRMRAECCVPIDSARVSAEELGWMTMDACVAEEARFTACCEQSGPVNGPHWPVLR